jgi:hypothetical protein
MQSIVASYSNRSMFVASLFAVEYHEYSLRAPFQYLTHERYVTTGRLVKYTRPSLRWMQCS